MSTHNCVSPAQCMNTNGSYVCDCPGGYELVGDGMSCQGTYTRTCFFSTHAHAHAHTHTHTVHQGIIAAVVVVGILLLLLTIFSVLMCWKYRRNKYVLHNLCFGNVVLFTIALTHGHNEAHTLFMCSERWSS